MEAWNFRAYTAPFPLGAAVATLEVCAVRNSSGPGEGGSVCPHMGQRPMGSAGCIPRSRERWEPS